MRILLSIALFLLLPRLGSSQEKIAFVPTPVNFAIKNAGLKVNGSMEGLEGFIILDVNNSSLIKIEGTIDPSTIQTGIALRNNHLKKSEYFNVNEFPRIHMTSTQISKKSNRKYVGNFDLTIKDIKKNVSIPFILTPTENEYVLKGEFSINRLDFKIGEESIILSDNVTVKIEVKTNAVEKKFSQ